MLSLAAQSTRGLDGDGKQGSRGEKKAKHCAISSRIGEEADDVTITSLSQAGDVLRSEISGMGLTACKSGDVV